jgi:hypothetical protein
MGTAVSRMSMRQRVLAVLEGNKPDRFPFISRMDFWYRGRGSQGTMPAEFRGMSLSDIHRQIGLGQEDWQYPYAIRYRGLELEMSFEGEEIYHEVDPEITNFPTLWGMVPTDKAGVTTTELRTAAGKLSLRHAMLEESVMSGTTRPQMVSRPIREEADYRIYEDIIERAEYVPRYDQFAGQEAQLGENGYLVPIVERIPFQHLLIDALGELELFYALYDRPRLVERLLRVLDIQVTEKLNRLKDLKVPYVEFTDNLDGFMTNPKLFAKYALPEYRRYSEILHRQGKKMGSHTDGDLRTLVGLLPECGLDVCESFTPAPITSCTFEEAWEAWRKGPLVWGGLPSYYLEERVSNQEFLDYVEQLLQIVGDRPIVLGIGDAVMSDNLVDRVRQAAKMVEQHII